MNTSPIIICKSSSSHLYIDMISLSRSLIYCSSKTILNTCLAHLIMRPVRSFEKIVECSADITVSHIQVCGNTQEKLCVHACYLFVIFPSKNSNVTPNRPLLFNKGIGISSGCK